MKKKLLCLPVEMYKREFDAKVFLGVQALERGYQVVIGNHKDPVFLKMPRGFYLYKDHGVGSIRLVKKWYEDNSTIAALDEEGLIPRSEEVYKRARISQESLDRLSVVFAWGEQQKTLLKRCGVNNEIIVSGNPRFDILQATRKQLEKSQSAKGDPKKILINTRFGSINSVKGENYTSVLRKLGEIETEEDVQEWFEFERNDRIIYEEFLRLIRMLGGVSDFDIIIRPHPEERSDPYQEVAAQYSNVRVDAQSGLIDHLIWCDIMVHDGCTTAIEARALGKEVLGLRPASVNYDYGAIANRFSINFATADDIFRVLNTSSDKILRETEEDDFAITQIANFRSGDAYRIILDVVDSSRLEEVNLVNSRRCRTRKALIHQSALAFYKKFPYKSIFNSRNSFLQKFKDLSYTYEQYDMKFPDMTKTHVVDAIVNGCRAADNEALVNRISIEMLSSKVFRMNLC